VSGETDVENFLIPLDMKLSLLLHFAYLLYQSDSQKLVPVKFLSLFWSYRFLSALLDVEEVRSLVSQHSNLSIILAFNPVIALSLSSLLVLCLE
jgi:hypothetical protein